MKTIHEVKVAEQSVLTYLIHCSYMHVCEIHRIKQQLCSDYDAVLNPNTCSRFTSLEDAVRHLLPYHTCSRALPSQTDLLIG